MSDSRHSPIRLAAFSEQSADANQTVLLQVYIINESPTTLEIWSDLDGINVPDRPPQGNETVHDADLIHVDFGASGSGRFLAVAPEECVKVTLVIRPEQVALLDRARSMKTAVQFRQGDKGDVTTVLLPAVVHKTRK